MTALEGLHKGYHQKTHISDRRGILSEKQFPASGDIRGCFQDIYHYVNREAQEGQIKQVIADVESQVADIQPDRDLYKPNKEVQGRLNYLLGRLFYYILVIVCGYNSQNRAKAEG